MGRPPSNRGPSWLVWDGAFRVRCILRCSLYGARCTMNPPSNYTDQALFRDHETSYLVASVLLVTAFMAAAVWYEVWHRGSDSPLETAAAVIRWVGPAIALAVAILAYREVIMVFAERYKAKRYKEGREEGRRERDALWEAWLKRRDSALANNQPFDEPPPSARPAVGS